MKAILSPLGSVTPAPEAMDEVMMGSVNSSSAAWIEPAGEAVSTVFHLPSAPSLPASMVAMSACEVMVGVNTKAARPRITGADRRLNTEWPLPGERRF